MLSQCLHLKGIVLQCGSGEDLALVVEEQGMLGACTDLGHSRSSGQRLNQLGSAVGES